MKPVVGDSAVRDRATEPERLSEEEYAERLKLLAEMRGLREQAIASGMRLWSQDEINEHLRRGETGEPPSPPTGDLE